MWRALAGVLWIAVAPAALACDGVSTCEAECSAGSAEACTTLADFAWANPWGLGLQADRMLSPYCQAGVVDACVVLARHRAATVGSGVDALLLGPCADGELSACAPLMEQGLAGASTEARARRAALASAASAYDGADSTVAPVLRILATGEVGDQEIELIDGCRAEGHCHGALSLLGTGRVGREALDWTRAGVAVPTRAALEPGVPRVGGADGALAAEVLYDGSRTLSLACEKSPAACFEGVDLALRLKEAYSCDRRVLDCVGIGNRLLQDLCAAGSPVGCAGDSKLLHWREHGVVAWFEEACMGDDPDPQACEALLFGLRHRDSVPAEVRKASLCALRPTPSCDQLPVSSQTALPEVVLLTDALTRCSGGEAEGCVALGATLAHDDANTAQAWFEAQACRAGDEAACRASWSLQLGEKPRTYGDAGAVTRAATARLAERCDDGSNEACWQLGDLTNDGHPAVLRARARSVAACRSDSITACRTAAALAYRIDGVEALSSDLDGLETRARRLCGASGANRVEACGAWSELERGFIVLPTGRLELQLVSTELRSIDRVTRTAASTCRRSEEACDALVALARQVRADACWAHETCPTETETLMREACSGGHELACAVRASEDPGLPACAQGDATACVLSGTWRSWRGLEVEPDGLRALCDDGHLEACALSGLPVPKRGAVCSTAVDCDVACRRGDGLACRELASSIHTLRPGEALAVQKLSVACQEGHAPACKTWARGLDLHAGARSVELEGALLERCVGGDAASCVWTARFQGREGLVELERLALADCTQAAPGACAWAAAAGLRLRAGSERSEALAPVAERLVGTAGQDCTAGDRRACNALGLAATGRTLPLPTDWTALEGPLPSKILEPVARLSLPTAVLPSEHWEALVKGAKKPCKAGDADACRDLLAGQMWTLETCTTARCVRASSKALCGLGVGPLCDGRSPDPAIAVWAGTLRSGTVGDERLVSDLRDRCLSAGHTESCVASAAEVLRREVVATPPTPDDRAVLEVACRSGVASACSSP